MIELSKGYTGVPVRPAVVGAFPTSLEWGQHDGGLDQERLCSDHDFGCIRLMGVWGLYLDGGVVPAEATGVMVWHPYYGEGASPHRCRGGHLGRKWEGVTVRCHCDNAAVVAIVNLGRSKVERVMHLMRSLFFFLAKFNVVLVGEHIPGVENGAADALSRDDLPSFLTQVPEAQPQPTPIPAAVMEALVVRQPDWTVVSWINLLTATS